MPLRFATPLGEELAVEGVRAGPRMCEWMGEEACRSRLCAQTVQEMMAEAGSAGTGSCGCGVKCLAGLREAAVPLRVGGEVFGYLLVGRVATRPLDREALNRWRHALERAGERVSVETLEELSRGVEVVTEEQFESALRLLEWSAGQLAAQLEVPVHRGGEAMAPPIRKACIYMRSHLEDALSLGRVATEVGMSREHFCSMFHKHTGLRFTEYLKRIRIERACERLRGTEDAVIEISHACGFQSVSHFNRCFRSVMGQSPTDYRRGEGVGSGR